MKKQIDVDKLKEIMKNANDYETELLKTNSVSSPFAAKLGYLESALERLIKESENGN